MTWRQGVRRLRGKTLRVLAVDDHPADRLLLITHLEAVGYQVTTAATVAALLSHLISDKPDVIVVDLQMPDMSGVDLVTGIRAAGCAVPIVAYSASDGWTRHEALAAGCQRYVRKTGMPEALIAAIESLV